LAKLYRFVLFATICEKDKMKSREYLDSISSETVKVLKDLHVDKLFQREKRVRIAVTGLNRSGKTIFITSLINQLLSGERE
jgi:polynucleotide 5'-kinase involved in rRNA processing